MGKLNLQYNLLIDASYLRLLNRKTRKLLTSGYPMNELYWIMCEDNVLKDKVIYIENLRFVEYQDNFNQNIKPFKK